MVHPVDLVLEPRKPWLVPWKGYDEVDEVTLVLSLGVVLAMGDD